MGPRVGVSNDTVLVLDGKPQCTIVYPAMEVGYFRLAKRFQEFVKTTTGVDLPACPDSEVRSLGYAIAPEYQRQNLILLGNLNNNAAFVILAANFHVYSTCVWPGENGFELRTVANPYGTKTNCLVLGGSDVSGVEMAVNEFVRLLPAPQPPGTLNVPGLLKVVVNGKDQAGLGAEDHDTAFGGMQGMYRIAGLCEAYNTTGSPERLRAVRKLLLKYLEKDQPPGAEDYGTEAAFRGLDLVDTVALTPEENLKMDNLILRWLLGKLKERPYWLQFGRSRSFGGHEACGTLSFYVACNFLLRNGSPDEEAREILERKRAEARQFLNYLSTSFKDSKKDVGWETWTPLAVLPRYALAEDDPTFFDSGTAANVVRRAFYADHGMGPAALVAFILNDPQFRSLAPGGQNLSGWAFTMGGANWTTPVPSQPVSPAFLLGTKVMESSRTDWEHACLEEGKPAGKWYTHLPWRKTFHLVGYAAGVTKQDQFAVMGGWDSTEMPGEANSIRIFRQAGHNFLFRADGNDQRKPRPGRFYQNSLVVNSGDFSQSPPCASELLAHLDGPTVGMAAARLSDFGGIDWERGIFWRRGRYFAVLDICTARREGSFLLSNQWWNNDGPSLSGNVWSAHTEHGVFRLVMDDPGEISSRQWWDGGPFQLRQSKLLNLKSGEKGSFNNAFYLDSRETPQGYEVRKVNLESMMVRGRWGGSSSEEIALIGYSGGKPVSAGKLRFGGGMYFISPDILALDIPGIVEVGGKTIIAAEDGTPKEGDPRLLRSALEELWDSLTPTPPAGEKASKAPRMSWGEASPRRQVAKTDHAAVPGVAFTKDADGRITWDLGRDLEVTWIDGIRMDGESVPVTCSSDGFKEDVRTVDAPTGVRHHWVSYQYGNAADLGQGTLGPIRQKARYFRIGKPSDKLSFGLWIAQSWHKQDWNVTGHNSELFNRPFWQEVVFRGDKPEVEITRTLAADLDGDGSQEVLAATSTYQLLALGADGTVRWEHRFDGPIMDMVCDDLEQDGRREILVACHDYAVYCFEHDEKLRYRADFLANRISAAVANSICTYDTGDGRKAPAIGTYHAVTKLDYLGKGVATVDGPGFYLDTAMPSAVDLTSDGIADFVMRDNVWGLVALIEGKEFKPIATNSTGHRGKGLAILPWTSGGRTSSVLVIAREGVTGLRMGGGSAGVSAGGGAAVVSGGDISTLFSLPISPITGWDVADVNGDGENEIVLGTLYRSVVIVSGDGRVLASALADGEVNDVCVLTSAAGEVRVLMATPGGISVFDPGLKPAGLHVVEGEPCIKLQRCADRGRDRALCFFRDGTAMSVSCE